VKARRGPGAAPSRPRPYYLDHRAERERITAAAHRFLTEELTFARSMNAMLNVIRARLAARS